MDKKRIIYSFYDYKTGRSELRQGDAAISENGTATISHRVFGSMKFSPGEYLLAEHFSLYWKRCVEQVVADRVKEKEDMVDAAA